MSKVFRLAVRYVLHHRWRSGILALGVALACFFPLALSLLVSGFSEALAARADSTPLVCGAQGSRFDLVLDALYFRGRVASTLTMAEVDSILESRLAVPVPVFARASARGRRLVGTVPEYYEFRELVAVQGRLPLWIGEAVLGSRVANELQLEPGDVLLTDQENLYDLSKSYPLKLAIVGVLDEMGTSDDEVVFCSTKTAWIVEGLAHGHLAAELQREQSVLARDAEGVVLDASIVEFAEVTPENESSFHFHGEVDQLPLTSIIVLPVDRRAETKLKGRYRVSRAAQLLEPQAVIAELLGFVFRIKRFFDANSTLAGAATALFMSIIVVLSLQARRRELETYFKLGVSRRQVATLLACEFVLVVAAGLLLALSAAWAVSLAGQSVREVLS